MCVTLIAEYMQSGRATEKPDVYSFGVLMLEVISGKWPTDASFIEKGLNIAGWVCPLFLIYFLLQKQENEDAQYFIHEVVVHV